MQKYKEELKSMPFFEEGFKGMVTPLGRIDFQMSNGYISQLYYLYNKEIYVTEKRQNGRYSHYRINPNIIGTFLHEHDGTPIHATFYAFEAGSHVVCRPMPGFNSFYLEYYNNECNGILLFESGSYDFDNWQNEHKDNYMHKNDKFEYKVSFSLFRLRILNMCGYEKPHF